MREYSLLPFCEPHAEVETSNEPHAEVEPHAEPRAEDEPHAEPRAEVSLTLKWKPNEPHAGIGQIEHIVTARILVLVILSFLFH